ncbi:MAG: hypothetical protein V1918_07825, partial [Planctomycetota bacterium]
ERALWRVLRLNQHDFLSVRLFASGLSLAPILKICVLYFCPHAILQAQLLAGLRLKTHERAQNKALHPA